MHEGTCTRGRARGGSTHEGGGVCAQGGVRAGRTCPEVETVEGEGAEVVTGTVAPPAFAPPRVGAVAPGCRPAHPEVGGLRREEGLHPLHRHLEVPLAVLRRALVRPQEDVGAHAAVGRRGSAPGTPQEHPETPRSNPWAPRDPHGHPETPQEHPKTPRSPPRPPGATHGHPETPRSTSRPPGAP